MPNKISVGLIEFDSEQYIESVALRDEVLRKPLGFSISLLDIEDDKNQYHIGATNGETLVGILLLKVLSTDLVKMRQVAVKPNFQNQGVGKKMVLFSEEFAKAIGFKTIELNARKVAVEFYLSQGYHIVSEQFMEVGIPHFKMEKSL
ncbi:MAG: GNAT family N-acetyltransferase [Flavobacteriales bacterium]|nr:GNAT family N-acetyltransferase [Flavobacteriales bacterium]